MHAHIIGSVLPLARSDVLCNALLRNIHKIGKCGRATVLQTNAACGLTVSRGSNFSYCLTIKTIWTIGKLLVSIAHRHEFYPTRPSRHAHSAKRCHDAALPSPGCHRIPFVLVKRQIRDETMPGLRWPGLLVCRTWNSYSICTSIYPVVTPTFLRRLSRAVCAFPGASCGYSPPLQSLLCTLNIASTDMLPSSFCAQLLSLCFLMSVFQMDIAFSYSVQVFLLYSMFEPPSRSFHRR